LKNFEYLEIEKLPLAKYIVHCANEVDQPEYLLDSQYDFSSVLKSMYFCLTKAKPLMICSFEVSVLEKKYRFLSFEYFFKYKTEQGLQHLLL